VTEALEAPWREAFRQAMRGLTSTVCLVTAADSVSRHLFTATSVTSVSFEPPSVLLCVNRASSAYPAFLRGAGFCVNVLARRHQALAQRCSVSSKGDAPFSEAKFIEGNHGIPILADAVSAIVCAQDGRFLYGTHAILIGRVLAVEVNDGDEPLLYGNGSYRSAQTP
jgi:flavin reductase (DIM6/NTAB) family NADH-FMN oxidoreductase RutF